MKLADKLQEIGTGGTKVNSRSTVARGKFLASFQLQGQQVIGVQV